MVYQIIGGFLLSSLGSTTKGESNLIQRLTSLSIVIVAFLLIIFAVNTFCYFSPQCTNFWEVLVPDWLEVYLGDLFLDQELQQQRQTSVITRVAISGGFGILPATLFRFREFIRR